MRFLSTFLPLLVFGVQTVLAGAKLPKVVPPQLPSNDSFYKPKGDWQKSKPGDILDSREVNISSLLPYARSKAKGFQLLYRTRDVHGNPDATVTTIIVPKFANYNRVLSVQNAYDSADVNCGPSYGLQWLASGFGASWNKLNLAFLMNFLQAGPIMNIPDYEGSNAAFTVGPQSGYQTLDSIRAVFNSAKFTNVNPDAKVIMFGYSGGAFATEWATEKKAEYAKDLPIIGAVMGAPPPNVTSTYLNADGSDMAELNVAALLGVMNAYPEINATLRANLTDDAEQQRRFFFPLHKCGGGECSQLGTPLAGSNVGDFFKNGSFFLEKYSETLKEIGVMGQNLTPKSYPGYPLFIFNGDKDELTYPIDDTIQLVKDWRKKAFTRVCHLTLEGLDHTTALRGLPYAWSWINKRFLAVEHGLGLVNLCKFIGADPDDGWPRPPKDGNPDDGKPDEGEPDEGEPDEGEPDEGEPDGREPDEDEPDNGEHEDDLIIAESEMDEAETMRPLHDL